MSDAMERLAELAQLQLWHEQHVQRLTEELAQVKDKLRKVCEEELPDAMEALGLANFRTTTGIRIKLENTVRANISKERAVEAFAYLRSNGYGALIKPRFEVNPESDQQAQQLRAALEEQTLCEFKETSTVHPSTLSAWVRDMLSAGKDLPQELLGVYRQRATKVEVKE